MKVITVTVEMPDHMYDALWSSGVYAAKQQGTMIEATDTIHIPESIFITTRSARNDFMQSISFFQMLIKESQQP